MKINSVLYHLLEMLKLLGGSALVTFILLFGILEPIGWIFDRFFPCPLKQDQGT